MFVCQQSKAVSWIRGEVDFVTSDAGSAHSKSSTLAQDCNSTELILLGADVVYHNDLVADLVATIATLLPATSATMTTETTFAATDSTATRSSACAMRTLPSCGGRFLMAYCERGAGQTFFDAMEAEGFECTLLAIQRQDRDGDFAEWKPSLHPFGELPCTLGDIRSDAAEAQNLGQFYKSSRYSILEFKRTCE